MKVTLVHQYFKHPREGGAIRSYYLAQGLLQKGAEVEVITTHNHPELQIKRIDGIKVFYLPIYYDNSLSKYQRIWAFLKFVFQSIGILYKVRKPRYLYVISTPLTVGAIALWMKFTRRIKYIFEIGDLWPEAPIQLGYIKNPMLKWVLYSLEKWIYRHAYRIVAMSPDIEIKIRQGSKVLMIPNMSDCEFFELTDTKPAALLDKYGIKDEFVIAYLGTAGRANQLEYLLDAAKAMHSAKLKIKYIVAAAGSELEHFRSEVLESKIDNIIFEPYTNKDGVKDLLSISDAVYVSFANVPILSSGSPNKFFDGLASGKLIIVNFEGWVKYEIEQANCGFSYHPNNPDELIDKIKPYLIDPNKLKIAQSNSRSLAATKFSRDKLINRWSNLFDFN